MATRPPSGQNVQPYLTIGDIARRFGLPLWKVRRVFERGLADPAERLGQYRVVPTERLPEVEAALKRAGYLG